jgi:hypothetical protein
LANGTAAPFSSDDVPRRAQKRRSQWLRNVNNQEATLPELHQQILYNALGLPHPPGKASKTLIDPRVEVSQM